MQKVILMKGAPSCGKSSYCRELMAAEPDKWQRINNDHARLMLTFSQYSPENEKVVKALREYLLRDFLKRGYNVLIDNVNSGSDHWKAVCKIVESLNLDVEVSEKKLYLPLAELIERDSKRQGNECVGEKVVKYWFDKLGGKNFEKYEERKQIFKNKDKNFVINALEQNTTLPSAIICDIDGTVSLLKDRSPYDASLCLNDEPIKHVIDMVRMCFDKGWHIIFCSGREDKYRDLTTHWLNTHVRPEIKLNAMDFEIMRYDLYMRKTDDFRKDYIIKEEIYNEHIKGKYNIRAVFDDRLQVAKLWYRLGLPLFRVNNPESNF